MELPADHGPYSTLQPSLQVDKTHNNFAGCSQPLWSSDCRTDPLDWVMWMNPPEPMTVAGQNTSVNNLNVLYRLDPQGIQMRLRWRSRRCIIK